MKVARNNERNEKMLEMLEERLEKLRKILLAEKSRIEREILSRERFSGEVLEEVGDFSILKLERKVEPGTFLGYFSDSKVHPYGFVVDSSGKVVMVKKAVSESENPEIFVEAESTTLYDVQLELIDAFDPNSVKPFSGSENETFVPKNELDEWQSKALSATLSLNDREFLLVVGPPGTGKTRFISVASKLLGRKGRILVTAHTNRAVDNVIEKLEPGFAVRLGYPFKLSPEVRKHAVETLSLKILSERRSAGDVVEILKEAERRVRKLLAEAKVVGATLMKCALTPYPLHEFEYAFVDEASQATIAEALAGLMYAKKVVLVGDPNQLPPVLSCRNPEQFSAFNFFSSLSDHTFWLRNHYRSDPEIIGFSAKYVYGGKLIPKSQKNRLTFDKTPERFRKILDPEKPAVFVAVRGEEERINSTKLNRTEAAVCAGICSEFLECGISDIAVITPYLGQKKLLESIGKLEVEINTVDAFQGREKDVVVFSSVSTRDLSFSSERRRFNVAVTRAKKKLIVLANPSAFRLRKNRKTLLYSYFLYARERNAVFSCGFNG